jgi:hypothetical protein
MSDPIDRSKWQSGPWDSEPDREEWHEGEVRCLLTRNYDHGAWHGYAIVQPSHPWAFLHWYALPTFVAEWGTVTPDGSTWFGFDCAHHGQGTPRSPYDAPYVTVGQARADLMELVGALSKSPPKEAKDVTIARLRRELSYFTGGGQWTTWQRDVLTRWLGLLGVST